MLSVKRSLKLKLAKCPKCGKHQELKKVLFINNFNSKICSSCGVNYELVKSRSTVMLFAVILPVIFGQNLPFISGFAGFVTVTIWGVVGMALYLKNMPLRLVGT